MEPNTPCFDVNGRQIYAGDILKVPHYTDRSAGRHVFMYKLVYACNSGLQLDVEGGWLYGVEITDIHRHGSIREAHKVLVTVDYALTIEVIDGGGVDKDSSPIWYERKKAKL